VVVEVAEAATVVAVVEAVMAVVAEAAATDRRPPGVALGLNEERKREKEKNSVIKRATKKIR